MELMTMEVRDMDNKIKVFGLSACLLIATPFFAGCASKEDQTSTGQFIDDRVITSKVKTKLFQDPVTSGFQIKVDTYKGKVQLSGFVESANEKQRATDLAKSVEGVQGVENNITVK